MDPPDAPEPLGRRHEQAVVRADEDIAAGDLDGDAESLGADARIDDRDVRADRQPGQAVPERQRAGADVEGGYVGGQVDDRGLRRDGQDDAAADGSRNGSEVGGHADEGHLDVPQARLSERLRPSCRPRTWAPEAWLAARQMRP